MSQYFQHTALHYLSEINRSIKLPFGLLEFYKNYEIEPSIYNKKPDEFKGIGLGKSMDNKIYLFNAFLNDEELRNELTYNISQIQEFGVLKFAANEFSNGGYYIGLNSTNFNKIYFYKNYVDWAEPNDIVLVSDSFEDFINNLRPVGINFNEIGTVLQFLTEETDNAGRIIRFIPKA